MKFSFDEGGDNGNIRDIIYDGTFQKKLEAFASAYRKAELKIQKQLEQECETANIKANKAIEELKTTFKKKLKVSTD